MVMGISKSQEGHNMKNFPNFLFTVFRGTRVPKIQISGNAPGYKKQTAIGDV